MRQSFQFRRKVERWLEFTRDCKTKMGQALDVIDFYFDFDNEENTSIPSNEANASEVADWLENFKGGKFQTSALKGAEGKDLYRTSKESLQASLGEELGKEFYDLFHK